MTVFVAVSVGRRRGVSLDAVVSAVTRSGLRTGCRVRFLTCQLEKRVHLWHGKRGVWVEVQEHVRPCTKAATVAHDAPLAYEAHQLRFPMRARVAHSLTAHGARV